MQKVIIFLLLLPAALLAQREPVLKQIDLPHPYYYREMYLPQLTSGPSWVTWSPDSKEVIYSMAGSLWRQKIDSTEAVQLTDGPGYDYQPDWSRDGKYVVYTKYHQDAMELWLLDITSGKSGQLTKDGAVNVEPRWSPDGKRIAYVSTAMTRHFHIFLMEMQNGCGDGGCPVSTLSPKAIRQLTKENISSLPRYYYSKFDHEISPAWSPDGKDIIFVSNHGHIHGTGGIWRATVPDSGMIDTSLGERTASAGPREPDARAKSLATEPSKDTPAKEIHYEETNWKARPEFSPDGKKIVYASYLGRQWHQLWLMPSSGGDVFPLTYGEYDNINPRWSPDGSSIVSITNENTNLDVSLVTMPSYSRRVIRMRVPHKEGLTLTSKIPYGLFRAHVTDKDGRELCSIDQLCHGDDSLFTRANVEWHYTTGQQQSFWSRSNTYQVDLFRGLNFKPQHLHFELAAHEAKQLEVLPFEPLSFNDKENWQSGDLHTHFNYGGSYHFYPGETYLEARAEDLGLTWDLIVNKEQRFPDIEWQSYIGRKWLEATNNRVGFGQEFHTSHWGHLGLVGVGHLIIPGYAGYPNTAAASLVPMNADVADMAHAQSKDALVGWVHPFDVLPDPYKDPKLTNELPIDVALGKVDYYEVLGFSDHKASAAIWYRLLNLGFHLPAGAGTDAMTNFASLRGPVGLNRVYVNVSPGPLKLDEWLKNLKAGKTFATNGPLLRFTLGGQPIGGQVKLDKPGEVKFAAALRSIVPVDKVEVVCNGAVAKTIFSPDQRSGATQAKSNPRSFAPVSRVGQNAREPSVAQDDAHKDYGEGQDDAHKNNGEVKDSQGHAATTSLDESGAVTVNKSGWCVLRAYSDHAEEPIMDIYPYGTTSPIYVSVAGEQPRSPEDARFFSKWIERVREDAAVHPDYNTPQEREHVLKVLDEAAGVYVGMQ